MENLKFCVETQNYFKSCNIMSNAQYIDKCFKVVVIPYYVWGKNGVGSVPLQ